MVSNVSLNNTMFLSSCIKDIYKFYLFLLRDIEKLNNSINYKYND